jgi:hypothetical protein
MCCKRGRRRSAASANRPASLHSINLPSSQHVHCCVKQLLATQMTGTHIYNSTLLHTIMCTHQLVAVGDGSPSVSNTAPAFHQPLQQTSSPTEHKQIALCSASRNHNNTREQAASTQPTACIGPCSPCDRPQQRWQTGLAQKWYHHTAGSIRTAVWCGKQ